MVQCVDGYCRILREEKDSQVKHHMLDYLLALVEDATRASHAVLLCRMEQGEVKNYTELKICRDLEEPMLKDTWLPHQVGFKIPRKRQKNNKVITCSYFYQVSSVPTKNLIHVFAQ